MVDTFAPDGFDSPVVDALVVAVLVALVATLGGLFALEPTVTAGTGVLAVALYAAFRLIYALERIADAIAEGDVEEPSRRPVSRSTSDRSSGDRSSSRS